MEYYSSKNEIEAVVFGTLMRTEAAVRTTKFNKIIAKLGVEEKYSPDSLKELARFLQSGEDKHLTDLVEQALKNEIDLENLEHMSESTTPFKKGNYFDVVTPYSIDRNRTLEMTREFNKAVRTGSYMNILMEDLKRHLNVHIKNERIKPKKVSKSKKTSNRGNKVTVVAGMTDWHIGAIVGSGMEHGGYDYDIFKSRLTSYLDHLEGVIKQKGASELVILHGGDLIESNEMRKNQSFETEFSLSEQIAIATKEILTVINRFPNIDIKVALVAGNHDRLSGIGNSKDRIYNDNITHTIVEILKTFKESGALGDNVEIIDNSKDTLSASLEVAGKNLHMIHGDYFKGKGGDIQKLIKDKPIDILFSGHIHHFNVMQEDYKRLHVVGGSIMGYNNYAVNLMLTYSAPSQTVMILEQGESPVIYPVFL